MFFFLYIFELSPKKFLGIKKLLHRFYK